MNFGVRGFKKKFSESLKFYCMKLVLPLNEFSNEISMIWFENYVLFLTSTSLFSMRIRNPQRIMILAKRYEHAFNIMHSHSNNFD